jgi:hypothetical protein
MNYKRPVARGPRQMAENAPTKVMPSRAPRMQAPRIGSQRNGRMPFRPTTKGPMR